MLRTWPTIQQLADCLAIPVGLTLEWLYPHDIEGFCRSLAEWYPDIVVGSESCHLATGFYNEECALGPIPDQAKDILAVTLRSFGAIVWFITFERNLQGGTLTARMGAIDPNQRGAGLALVGPQMLEACARLMGCGLAYYLATLKIPHQQVCAEKSGFNLVGIIPAYDVDMVRPGEPRRVYEAIYAKILATEDQVETPEMANLTPQTKRLFDFIFSSKPA